MSDNLEFPCVVASRGRNPDNPKSRKAGLSTEQQLELNREGVSNCVTTVAKDNWIIEPAVLKKERTLMGKKFRKQYESKQVSMSRKETSKPSLHTDGCSNTLTTVQKDNYLAEPVDAQVVVVGNYTKCGHESGRVVQQDGISPTVKENHGRVITILDDTTDSGLKFVGGIGDYDRVGDGKKLSRNFRTSDRVYDPDGVAATLTASSCGLAGYSGGLYVERADTDMEKNKLVDELNSLAKHQQDLVQSDSGVFRTLVAGSHLNSDTYTKTVVDTPSYKYPLRLRKLTPKECWRLQGFDDIDIDRCIESGVSSSQLYKQAGNSIAVNCLCAIFSSLFGISDDSISIVDAKLRLF